MGNEKINEHRVSPSLALLTITVAHMMHHIYGLIIPPLLPIFKSIYRLNYFQAGFLPAAFNIGMIMQLFVGIYSDRTKKRKNISSLGLIGSAVLVAIAGLTNSYLTLAIVIILLGIIASTYHPPSTALVTEYFPKSKRGRTLGVNLVGGSVGTGMGPIILGALIIYISWQQSLFILAIPGVIAGLLYFGYVKDLPNSEKMTAVSIDASENSFHWHSVAPKIVIALTAFLLGLSGFICLQNFLPLYLITRFDVNISFAAFLLGTLQIAGIVGGPLGGLFSDRFGRGRMIILSLFLQPILVYLLIHIPLSFLMYVLIFLTGFFTYTLFSSITAYLADEVPSSFRATIYAVYFTSQFAWWAIISIIAGNMIDVIGFQKAFTILALISAGGAILSLVLIKKTT